MLRCAHDDAHRVSEHDVSPAILALGGAQSAMTGRVVTGRAMGLLVCLECHAAVRALQVQHPRCTRCFAHRHIRKPHSMAVTATLLVLASILYVPANVLPVMFTRSIIDDER